MSGFDLEGTKTHQQFLITEIFRVMDTDQKKWKRLNEEYDAIVAKLLEVLGDDAHCCEVDPGLWDTFSDLYKDDVGSRPRGHFTRAQVLDYLTKTGRLV